MKQAAKQIRSVGVVVLGNAILTFAIAAFVLPNRLISGGVTGIALVFEHFFSMDVSAGVAVANGVLFLAGAVVLGKKFALTTLLSTVLYPVFLSLFRQLDALQHLTQDTLLAALYAGILMGAGMGLVIREGSSTGGMDIPPLILNKYFGWSVPALIYVFDTAILLTQVFFSTSEQVLYGIAVVLVTSLVMDRVMVMGKNQAQVTVITPRYEEVAQAVQEKLDRGCGDDGGLPAGVDRPEQTGAGDRRGGLFGHQQGQRGAGPRLLPGKTAHRGRLRPDGAGVASPRQAAFWAQKKPPAVGAASGLF